MVGSLLEGVARQRDCIRDVIDTDERAARSIVLEFMALENDIALESIACGAPQGGYRHAAVQVAYQSRLAGHQQKNRIVKQCLGVYIAAVVIAHHLDLRILELLFNSRPLYASPHSKAHLQFSLAVVGKHCTDFEDCVDNPTAFFSPAQLRRLFVRVRRPYGQL